MVVFNQNVLRNWPRLMSKLQDSDYLQNEQYRNAEKLNARICLHTKFSTNGYGWFRWVFDHLILSSGNQVLELGCGPGDLWLKNSHRIPEKLEITLSDFSLGMAYQARDNLSALPSRFFLGVIDVQAIPFGDEQFQVVIANHFLYHVPNRSRALSEIYRVLKPGGCLYTTTIGEKHLEEMSHLLMRFDPTVEDVFKSPERPFTLENGEDQLRAWFSLEKVERYPDSLLINEVEPLVEYVLSTVRFDQVEDRREELTVFLRSEMDANGGAILVKKESGLFTAVKD